jgi:RimJ/RimL family protein N-acetyltransferase
MFAAVIRDCRAFVSGAAPLSIPVTLGGAVIASLEPITIARQDDAHLIAQLTEWRNAARAAFFTQFEATPERTREWLARQVLTDPARLLFTVDDAEGPLGTIGFMRLSQTSAELDNLIRGVRRGPPALMRAAETALARWLFDTFGLVQLEAAVLAGNFAAMQLHQSLGFEIVRRIPLVRTERDGEIAFVESGGLDDNGPAKLLFVLKREAFTP